MALNGVYLCTLYNLSLCD